MQTLTATSATRGRICRSSGHKETYSNGSIHATQYGSNQASDDPARRALLTLARLLEQVKGLDPVDLHQSGIMVGLGEEHDGALAPA